jgi:hypothetical protein
LKATRNNFIKGLKNEKDPLSVTGDEYVDALNIRIESDEGGSSYSVINIKGNRYETSIPDVPPMVAITPNFDFVLVFVNTEVIPSLIIDGNLITGAPVYAQERSYLILFKQLENAFKTDPAFAPYNLQVARQGLRLVITSQTNTVSPAPSTPVINQEAIVGMTGESQIIIGWAHSDVSFYILTTDNRGNGGHGAVWKLTYDGVDFTYTWDIRYSSPDLRFTTKHPVANPSGIEVSDETEEIVRLSWTDNYNSLRFLNVESPNSLALTVGMLNVYDGQTNPIPVFKDVLTGGALKNGAYQIAYRLRADDASYTLMSQHSNVINVTEDAEHAYVALTNYEGADSDQDQIAGKALTFEFSIPETAYSFLEIFTLFRATRTSVPEVRLVSEIPIDSNNITYTISGAEESASFTFEEFQNLYTPFTHCKTIAQKDSILFAGNVRSDDFDVEFDPRAYGHNKNQQSYISTAQEIYPSDQTLDAINPDFDEYRYTADGITYGGEGPNVRYSFVRRFHFGDTAKYLPTGEWNTPKDSTASERYLFSWEPGTNDVPSITNSSGGKRTYRGITEAHMSPWEAAAFRGYKRGEIYRFSFVPVKNGQEGRAKWIADIKIPHYSDEPDANVSGNWWDDYRISRRNPNDHTPALTPIGIKFDIDVSSIANDIDYYKIKRVKRTDSDKTILASGIIGLTAGRTGADRPGFYLDACQDRINGAGLGTTQPTQTTDSRPRVFIEGDLGNTETGESPNKFAFYSPDINFKQSFDSRGGDQLRVYSLLHPTINLNAPRGVDSFMCNARSTNTQITKLYRQLNIKDEFPAFVDTGKAYKSIDIKDAGICEYGASVEFTNGETFHNRSWCRKAVGTPNAIGILQDQLGTKCLAVLANEGLPFMDVYVQGGSVDYGVSNSVDTRLCEDITFSPGSLTLGLFGEPNTIDVVRGNPKTQLRRYADYYRPLKAQYGGNTYAARSKNVYIDTGTCVKVSADTTTSSIDVFGGDTYINIFGITTLTRNIATYQDNSEALAAAEDYSNIKTHPKLMFNYIEFFPVESDVNTDLRQGFYFNKSGSQISFPGLDLRNHYAGDPEPDLDPNWGDLETWEVFVPKDMLKVGEDFIYNFTYSNEEDLQPSFPEPLAGEEVDVFPTRIYASDVKISGEIVNSWRRFRTQSFIEINSAHGPINAIVNNLDRIIALQDDAMGTASVNERQVAQTQTGEATILGNSGVLPRFDYITKHTGSRHQFGLVLSPNSLYFYDVSDGVLYRFDGQKITPISQVGELNQFFYNTFRGELLRNDNPIHDADFSFFSYNPLGITGTYDYRFNEALFTFHTIINGQYVSKTLVYNENGSTFTSFYGFTPTVYLNDRENIFSPGKPVQLIGTPQQHKLYIHNKGERGVFYDEAPQESYVEMIVAPESPSSKIFTNLEWNSEVFDSSGNNTFDETVDSITISNEYQTLPNLTQYQRRFRTWRATIPREAITRARLRGHYMRMRYTFNNSDDRKFVLSGVTTIYDMTAY